MAYESIIQTCDYCNGAIYTEEMDGSWIYYTEGYDRVYAHTECAEVCDDVIIRKVYFDRPNYYH